MRISDYVNSETGITFTSRFTATSIIDETPLRDYAYAIMGRPKLPREELRDRPIPVRVSSQERELIEEAASISGYATVSEAVRDVLLGWANKVTRRASRQN